MLRKYVILIKNAGDFNQDQSYGYPHFTPRDQQAVITTLLYKGERINSQVQFEFNSHSPHIILILTWVFEC